MDSPKQRMITIGVYGSLKSGFYNHERFGLDKCNRLSPDLTIMGSMFMSNGYPEMYLEPYGYDGIMPPIKDYPLEVYEVPEDLFEILDGMEVGAGYRQSWLPQLNDRRVIIWIKVADNQNKYPEMDRWIEAYDHDTLKKFGYEV